MNELLPVTRFIHTLETVEKEIRHLQYSWHRVFSEEINANWVKNLENTPETAERMEAFISRFGRTQDTISDKLLPRWLMALAEKTGSQIEILNRAERLGILQNTENWLQARYLRNRLVHEYHDRSRCIRQRPAVGKNIQPNVFIHLQSGSSVCHRQDAN
ncbi:hypothetical protein [Thiolapillus sp.]|uniref:hypothetical protein n=1 Tax=Thiolapillus sp. TaxID=2017437 RepID=UPI0026001333|nr:hypothetical protein [Thiolapillus sp.]